MGPSPRPFRRKLHHTRACVPIRRQVNVLGPGSPSDAHLASRESDGQAPEGSSLLAHQTHQLDRPPLPPLVAFLAICNCLGTRARALGHSSSGIRLKLPELPGTYFWIFPPKYVLIGRLAGYVLLDFFPKVRTGKVRTDR